MSVSGFKLSKLEGKRALVTAGAQGIGESITRRFIESGANVAIHYHSSEDKAKELVALARDAGLKACAVSGDLTKRSDVDRLAESVEAELGGLDCLINNAGSLIARRSLEEIDEDYWHSVMDLNVTSLQMVTQAVIGMLARNECSSIVSLSSLAGRKGGGGGALVYSAAKGAIQTWTRTLACELGPRGVRVNSVSPGLILGTSFHDTHTPSETQAAIIETLPLARAGNPDDVARAVMFLASEYDGFITGATIDINGGVYAS